MHTLTLQVEDSVYEKVMRFLNEFNRDQIVVEETMNDVEAAWEEEIAKRVKAIATGTAQSLDYDTAMEKLEKRFGA